MDGNDERRSLVNCSSLYIPGFLTVYFKGVHDAMRQVIDYVHCTMETLDYGQTNIQLGDDRMKSITVKYKNEPQVDDFGTILICTHLASTQGTGSDHKR